MPRSTPSILLLCLASAALAAGLAPGLASAGPIEDRLAEAFGGLDAHTLKTGVLYDRVLPLSGIERFDGRAGAPPASLRLWRQIYDELRRAGADPAARPAPEELLARGRERHDAIPIALLFDRYERIRRDALERGTLELRDGRLMPGPGDAFELHTAFAAAALQPASWRGNDVRFVLDRGAFFSNARAPLADLEVDLGDGLGFRRARFDVPLQARYAETGSKILRVRANAEGKTVEASLMFAVNALAAPLPNDTLHVTGTIPYLSGVASGDAYVYLAPGRTALLNPAVVVEGFDLDNTMNWDELYALLNQQQLIETLRADGYDAVVLNFADATDYLQRNSFLLVELLQQLRATVGPQTTVALAGASMGGLVSRYALAYMETHGIPSSVRTFVSFDAPQLGADIPLGIQHWMRFFSGQSADAAALLALLDRPAARQMLVYHYTNPAGTNGQPDALRGTFLADLTAAGDWPALPRKVAIANGSGIGAGQGFAAGAQIIQWTYSDFLVTIRGNVWAVPNNLPITKIFDGSLRILFSTTSQIVNVSTTQPYDNAPGGSRATMTQMDTTAAPYGDIVALYPSHCFIPTVSALAFATTDLFHNIATDPDPLSHTPFDAIYTPTTNQEHVLITAQNAAWIRSEIELGVTGVSPLGRPALQLRAPVPNPSSGRVRITFALPRATRVDLRVFDVDGRELAQLATGRWGAGAHDVEWTGMDRRGALAPSGVYFVRFAADGRVETRRLVRFK